MRKELEDDGWEDGLPESPLGLLAKRTMKSLPGRKGMDRSENGPGQSSSIQQEPLLSRTQFELTGEVSTGIVCVYMPEVFRPDMLPANPIRAFDICRPLLMFRDSRADFAI